MPYINEARVKFICSMLVFEYEREAVIAEIADRELFERTENLYKKADNDLGIAIVTFDNFNKIAIYEEFGHMLETIAERFEQSTKKDLYSIIDKPMQETIAYVKSIGEQHPDIYIAITNDEFYCVMGSSMTDNEILALIKQITAQ